MGERIDSDPFGDSVCETAEEDRSHHNLVPRIGSVSLAITYHPPEPTELTRDEIHMYDYR